MVQTYRSKNDIHEMIQLFGVHQAAALENAHGELGDDGQVAFEVLADDFAELFIVLQGFNFFKLAKGVKRLVVELVDFFDVWVCYNNVGELLHVTDPMRNSIKCIPRLALSHWQNKRHGGITSLGVRFGRSLQSL